MAKTKGKREKDWLDGSRQQEVDFIREAVGEAAAKWPDHEIEKGIDTRRYDRMESAAFCPEQVLIHAVTEIKKLQRFFALREIPKTRRNFTKADCRDPTLRVMSDAWSWLHKAGFTLDSGRRLAEQIKTAKDEESRQAACILAVQELSRSISFAYYAGIKCGELKARVSYQQTFARPKKSLEFRLMPPLCLLAFAARFRLLNRKGREPTDGDIYLEIERDTKNARKSSAGHYEFRSGGQAWKRLPALNGFRSRMSEWRKKYPGLG